MGNGRSERCLGSPLRINVNELMILCDVGKTIDAGLIYAQPFSRCQRLADEVWELLMFNYGHDN